MTAPAPKVDLKKALDCYRARAGEVRVLDVPDMAYLMIDGHGDPDTAPEYGEALEALYPVSYKLKFASKRDLGRDYVVTPLEGLWWAEDMEVFTGARDKGRWDWTMMILVPDWIDAAMVDDAIQLVGRKDPPARLADLRYESLSEGRCVQTLHIGPYDDEAEVIQRMHAEVTASGSELTGKHHEIYLTDPRRTAPEKLRTILRQPFTS